MNQDDHRHIHELFLKLCDVPEPERECRLEQLAMTPEVRAELESLLAEDASPLPVGTSYRRYGKRLRRGLLDDCSLNADNR
jgi:hypothetical protein